MSDNEMIALSIRIPKEMHQIIVDSKEPGASLNDRARELLTQALLSEGHKLSWVDDEDIKPFTVNFDNWDDDENLNKLAEKIADKVMRPRLQ